MVFDTKSALLAQMAADKLPASVRLWAARQQDLTTIVANIPSQWRKLCIERGYENFARLDADLHDLDNSERIVQTAVRVTELEESGGGGGTPGKSAYCYIAYASDDEGSDFTLTFDPDLDYIAILSTDEELDPPTAEDFEGLWKCYKGQPGEKGEQGEQGPPGEAGPKGDKGDPGLVWKGAWSDSVTYAVGDAVAHSGSSYICVQSHTNQQPPNPVYWDVLAQGA